MRADLCDILECILIAAVAICICAWLQLFDVMGLM
jgi:hypothetical protein